MATFKSYCIGFIASIVLTLAAYFAVVNHQLGGALLVTVIVSLAFLQLIVQLIFFLHFGQGEDGRWNIVIFLSTLGIIFILIIGSIWIMNHLNYRMTPQDINNYLNGQDGI